MLHVLVVGLVLAGAPKAAETKPAAAKPTEAKPAATKPAEPPAAAQPPEGGREDVAARAERRATVLRELGERHKLSSEKVKEAGTLLEAFFKQTASLRSQVQEGKLSMEQMREQATAQRQQLETQLVQVLGQAAYDDLKQQIRFGPRGQRGPGGPGSAPAE